MKKYKEEKYFITNILSLFLICLYYLWLCDYLLFQIKKILLYLCIFND